MRFKRFLLYWCILLFLGTAKGEGPVPSTPQEIYASYSLAELYGYFTGHSRNDRYKDDTSGIIYEYQEINAHFPIELTRYCEIYINSDFINAPAYSVYRVKEGGYYYLFWNLEIRGEARAFVLAFSTYISNRSSNNFHFQIVQTLSDAFTLDPFLDFNDRLSRGVFSYSYCSPDTLYEIEYTMELSDNKPVYRVKKIKLIARKEGASYYSMIRDDDLPCSSSQYFPYESTGEEGDAETEYFRMRSRELAAEIYPETDLSQYKEDVSVMESILFNKRYVSLK